ncbi:hypothetical protein VIN01S_01040 [Vibrio inusitatus NBRC 102082]|uniref:Uncharacterized protein n=1 Tax=Vibrio inusitatus NBRC 102082 TaxID=1219070 RepID=A0A4Y3HR94_9VIBR|nr:hypothetical protein [Vibrio inusitatus]GEA49300.1 hypothetical protein VIN01S_01040 [Vibrio inusitatus NBRC 102082]
MHHSRGYTLFIVLSVLFVMGFFALDNSRYLTDSIKWQAHLHHKRLNLDWQLESVINCLAIHTVSLQALPTAQCVKDDSTHLSVVAFETKNQFKLQADQGTLASSAVMQLGKMQYDVAIASNRVLPEGVWGSSVLVEPSVISNFFGEDDIGVLKLRWGKEIEVTLKQACGDEILLHSANGARSLIINGDCSISPYHWDQLTVLSTTDPFFLLFVGGDLGFSGSQWLQGVIAIWHSEEEYHEVNIAGNLRIEGGLLIDTSTSILLEQGSLDVVENEGHLMMSRFKFAKREWLNGSWRDF